MTFFVYSSFLVKNKGLPSSLPVHRASELLGSKAGVKEPRNGQSLGGGLESRVLWGLGGTFPISLGCMVSKALTSLQVSTVIWSAWPVLHNGLGSMRMALGPLQICPLKL